MELNKQITQSKNKGLYNSLLEESINSVKLEVYYKNGFIYRGQTINKAYSFFYTPPIFNRDLIKSNIKQNGKHERTERTNRERKAI